MQAKAQAHCIWMLVLVLEIKICPFCVIAFVLALVLASLVKTWLNAYFLCRHHCNVPFLSFSGQRLRGDSGQQSKYMRTSYRA